MEASEVSPLIPSILHLSLLISTEHISDNHGKFNSRPAEFLFPVDSSFKSENPFHNNKSHEIIITSISPPKTVQM